jgi:hypothetical protein
MVASRARHLGSAFLLALSLAIPLGSPAAATHEPTLISDAPGKQVAARTDGATIVWVDWRDNDIYDADIYGAHLSDHREFPIATGPVDESEVEIDDGVVIWSAYQDPTGVSTNRDVRGKILATGMELDIAVTADDETRPEISGDRVVWSRLDDAGISLWARNLGEVRAGGPLGEPFQVYAIPDDVGYGGFAFNGDRLVWVEEYYANNATWHLFTLRLGEAEPALVAEGGSVSGSSFGFDVAGDLVVYVDSFFNLVAVDLSTGETTLIDTRASARFPTTDGRYVFALHEGRADDGIKFDLWGYDLQTHSLFPASIGTDWTYSAHVDSGILTWSRGDDDDADVYAAPIAEILPSARRPDPGTTDPAWRYFPATGHVLAWGFKGFWDGNGGLPVFGYPLTEEFAEKNPDTGAFHTVQYVERQRFEWHPEYQGTPYAVLLGRLGAQLLELQGRDWTAFPKADPSAPHYVAETGHAVAPAFWDYWSQHGLEFGDAGVSFREALALFGYPLSEPLMETNADGDTVLTQYFERAVFEWHPDHHEPQRVLLRRLGAELLAERGW